MDANQKNNVNPLTIKQMLDIIWHKKILLGIFILIGFIGAIISSAVTNANTAKISTFVDLQWDGLISGEYPDGSSFDYSKMFESYMYQQAIVELDLDINNSELRNALVIKPIVPNNVLQLIENELRNGNHYSFIASEYKITLSYGNLNINQVQAEALLKQVIDEFKVAFENKYIQKTEISNYLIEDYTEYEYLETVRLFESQISLMRTAINRVMPEAADFKSTENNLGFDEILLRTNLVQSIDLVNINTLLNSYLMVKNPNLFLMNLKYQNEVNNRLLQEKTEMSIALNDMISNYEGSTVTIIIPGVDYSDGFTYDPYLNTLYEKLVGVTEQITALNNKITQNQTLIDRLENNDPNFTFDLSEQAANEIIVQQRIEKVNETLFDIVEDLDIVFREYNTTLSKNAVRMLVSPNFDSDVNYLFYVIVGLALGGGLGIVAVFISHNYDEKKKYVQEK